MRPEVRERLRHVVDAGEMVLSATSGKTFTEYSENKIVKYAVERAFTIIGEALREVARVDPQVANGINGYRRIVDFRNVLVHDYATVYDEGVWLIIHEHLPVRLTQVRTLLATPPEPE